MAETKNLTELEKLLIIGCKKGNHNLEKIAEYGSDMESKVVRWCPICGSVVVDVDYDNRLKPGGVMKMRSPLIFATLNRVER